MGNDCYFQVLNLGALATMIGVTKPRIDNYTSVIQICNQLAQS